MQSSSKIRKGNLAVLVLLLIAALLSCAKGRGVQVSQVRVSPPAPIELPRPPIVTPPAKPKEIPAEAKVEQTGEPYVVKLKVELPEGLKPAKMIFKPDVREEFRTELPLSAIENGISWDYGKPGVFKAQITIFDSNRNRYHSEPRIRSFNPTINTKGTFYLFAAGSRWIPGPTPASAKSTSSYRYRLRPWDYVDEGPWERKAVKPQIYSIGPFREVEGGVKPEVWADYGVNNLTDYGYANFEWIYDNFERYNDFESGVFGPGDLYKGMRHHLEWSPDGTEVVFTSNHEVFPEGWPPKILHNDIYVMNADGTFLRRVIEDRRTKGRVSFSPDATYVVYDWREEDDWSLNRRIAMLDLATGESQELTDGTYDEYFPTFTPEGGAVLFTRREAEHYKVCKIDLKSLKTDTVWDWDEDSANPVFSPKGDRLAVTVWTPGKDDQGFEGRLVGFKVLEYPSLKAIISASDFDFLGTEKGWVEFVGFDPVPRFFAGFTPWGDDIMLFNNYIHLGGGYVSLQGLVSWRTEKILTVIGRMEYPRQDMAGAKSESGFFSPQSWPKNN